MIVQSPSGALLTLIFSTSSIAFEAAAALSNHQNWSPSADADLESRNPDLLVSICAV